jgi:hypothetical protein
MDEGDNSDSKPERRFLISVINADGGGMVLAVGNSFFGIFPLNLERTSQSRVSKRNCLVLRGVAVDKVPTDSILVGPCGYNVSGLAFNSARIFVRSVIAINNSGRISFSPFLGAPRKLIPNVKVYVIS